MNIITLITKRSVRETDPKLREKLFFSSGAFDIGSVIEVIDGNRKSPAYVFNIEDASNYKQEIRSGALSLNKIKLSKSGEYCDGKVITSYTKKEFSKYLEKPDLAQKTEDLFLKDFFPKKRLKKKIVKNKRVSAESFSSLSMDQYFSGTKSHPTEMHELVDTIRNYFGETAKYGQGSFSYYLGFFKKIPNQDIYQMFGEAKQSKKPIKDQKKIFWWKVGQYVKKK